MRFCLFIRKPSKFFRIMKDFHENTKPDNRTPGDQAGHYETGTPEEVRQETRQLNSLGYDSESPKPVVKNK